MKTNKVFLCFMLSFILIASFPLTCFALHGDVNNDDYIGIEDAVLALQFATGIEEPNEDQQHSADLDYDGFITTKDVRLIMRGAANIDYVPDHLFSQWEMVIEPTCTENGLAVCHCLYCEKEVKKTISPNGHTIENATCTKAAYCTICEESFGEPLEHTEKDGYCSICNTLLYSPILTYKGEEIAFGCSSSAVKTALGTPNNTLTDNYAEKTVIIYVYYTDYTDLGIFTFTDGKLTQFFTNCTSSEISQGSTGYSLKSEYVPETIGDISVTAYKDTLGNNNNYSFCSTVGEAYNLKKTTKYTVNAKLNFHLTNGLRAINGVSVLKYSSDAAAVAAAHSTDMAKRNFFNHENPDGERVGARLTAGGVEWTACGENIVAGYYDPYAISNGWYNSEGHRKNILNSNYKYLGVGFAYNESADYKYYGTQNFYTN